MEKLIGNFKNQKVDLKFLKGGYLIATDGVYIFFNKDGYTKEAHREDIKGGIHVIDRGGDTDSGI